LSNKSRWCGQGAQTKAPLEVRKRIVSNPTRVKIKLKPRQAFVEKFFLFLRNLKKESAKIVLLEPKLQFIKDLTISKESWNIGIV
jgi:DNA repair protein RadC